MSGRGIEFVVNREPQGCFGADVEGLTGVGQDEVHGALAASELYNSNSGLFYTPAHMLNDSMLKGRVALGFKDELPFYDGFGGGDESAIDDSPQAASERLEILRETLLWDDHEGLIILYPCQRREDQDPFAHYVAAVEPRDGDAALMVMDPSELPGHGGVFQRSEKEVLSMLTPNPDMGIPILAYTVRRVDLPEGNPDEEAEAAAEEVIPTEDSEAEADGEVRRSREPALIL